MKIIPLELVTLGIGSHDYVVVDSSFVNGRVSAVFIAADSAC